MSKILLILFDDFWRLLTWPLLRSAEMGEVGVYNFSLDFRVGNVFVATGLGFHLCNFEPAAV